jgi:hypothetical protein
MVTFALFGGTVGCDFTTTIDWGYNGATASGTYGGQPNNGLDASWVYTYPTTVGVTYDITVTTMALAPCSGSETFPLTFTLAASSTLSVDAGPDQTVTGTTVVQLAGSVSDPSASTSWSVYSAQSASGITPAGSATISDVSSLATTATVTEPGVYVFQLTAAKPPQVASALVRITFDAGLPAGTFVGMFYRPGAPAGPQACTTGFAVATGTGNNQVDYELGAKHCLDGDIGDQQTNDLIPFFQPITITQLLGTTSSPPLGTTYAQSLRCLPRGTDCLLPKPSASRPGDIMAWKPDSVKPSALVQTAHGLLPVVGQRTLSAGTQVCHYGWGSLGSLQQAEQCGPPPDGVERLFICRVGKSSCRPGTQLFLAPAMGGDSGGPVYSYDMVNGRPVGVFAIGVVVSQGTITSALRYTIFIPIAEIENRFKVALLKQNPLP